MTNWLDVSFTDVCDIEGGTQPPKSTFRYEETDGYVRMLQIQDFKSDKKPVFIAASARMKTCSESDILIARYGASLGQILRGKSGAYNVALVKTIPDHSRLNDGFFFHILNGIAFQSFLANVGGRAAQAGFNKGDLERFRFTLPPLSEQKRIAEILDRAEVLRAKRRTALALLDELTQSIFLDMFGDPVSNERGWNSKKVADAGRVQLGRQRAPKYQSGKFTRPYVRVANVYENRLALSDVLLMDFNDSDFKAYRLQHGDILLNEGQSTELVGRPAMWRNEIPDCCYQNTLVRFQCERKTTLPEFALALFLYYFRRGEFAKISSKTSNVAHLGAARFGLMPFILPPLDVQQAFVQRIECLDKTKAANVESLSGLEQLFASLQNRAFRGEL